MTDDPTSFRLSPGSLLTLSHKARAFNVSKTVVLEWMIKEFEPSTTEEIKKQSRRRQLLRKEYFAQNPKATPEQAYRAGYSAGWLQFQTRKNNNIFKVAP